MKIERNHDELKTFAFNLLLHMGFKRNLIDEEYKLEVKNFNGEVKEIKVDIIAWFSEYYKLHSDVGDKYRGVIIECGDCPAERVTLLRTQFIVIHLPYNTFPTSLNNLEKDMVKEIYNYSKNLSDSVVSQIEENNKLNKIIEEFKNKTHKEFIKEEVKYIGGEEINRKIEDAKSRFCVKIDEIIEKKIYDEIGILDRVFYLYMNQFKTHGDIIDLYKKIKSGNENEN